MASMVSRALIVAPQTTQDPLAHLPRSVIVEYKKRQVIYNQDRPSAGLYVIINGMVKLCRLAADGREVVMEIFRAGDYFGESALLGLPQHAEQAAAMEETVVMMWSAAQIEDILANQPKLAVALWHVLVQRMLDLGRRIESFSRDDVPHRLARSLIHLSERLGTPDGDGSIQMSAFTHELLSQYVGTSREIVSHYMNYFRKQGYLRYSRKGISLYSEAFKVWLREESNVAVLR